MVLKVTVIVIITFGENNVLGSIYIYILYINFGRGPGCMVHLSFLVYYS